MACLQRFVHRIINSTRLSINFQCKEPFAARYVVLKSIHVPLSFTEHCCLYHTPPLPAALPSPTPSAPSLQIQRKESAYEPGAPNAPAPGTRDLPWAAKTGNLFQLGAVLGCAAVRYGFDRGARRVELLAIRENDRQHSR